MSDQMVGLCWTAVSSRLGLISSTFALYQFLELELYQSSTERPVRFGSYSPFGPTPAASLRSADGGFRSDTGRLASLARRSWFVAIGFRTGWTLRTLTIKSEDLTPFLRN